MNRAPITRRTEHAGAAIVIIVCLLCAGRGLADNSNEAAFFVLGPKDVGLSVGYGHGVSITSSGRFEGRQVRELVIVAHWQIELTREPIRPAWYKGVLAFRAEPTLLVNFRPRTGVAGGIAGMLRYQLTHFGATRPFVEAGAGIIGLSFDVFDQADGLAFIPTAGVGVVHRVGERLSVQLSLRFQHISNAFTQYPNGGIDTFQYQAGVAYHF